MEVDGDQILDIQAGSARTRIGPPLVDSYQDHASLWLPLALPSENFLVAPEFTGALPSASSCFHTYVLVIGFPPEMSPPSTWPSPSPTVVHSQSPLFAPKSLPTIPSPEGPSTPSLCLPG